MLRTLSTLALVTALTGCVGGLVPTTFSVSYPDTSFDSTTSAQIIPAGGSSVEIQISFGEPVTGFEQSDLSITGGTISSFSSNSEATMWTIVVDIDEDNPPSEITFNFTGTIDAAFGNTWSPNISGRFTYPTSDFTFAERQGESGSNWGVTRATSTTESAVVYSENYATTIANGVLPAAVEMATTSMELVQSGLHGGLSSYRGTISVGDETYSAEMHVTASGAIGLRIFDPSHIVLTKGDVFTATLAGSYDYDGTISATRYETDSYTHTQGDFALTANFTTESFTIASGPDAGDNFVLTGSGVLNPTTGVIASDTLVMTHTQDPDDAISGLVAFGNIHGNGTDVTGLFYNTGFVTEGTDTVEALYVGTFVGSQ